MKINLYEIQMNIRKYVLDFIIKYFLANRGPRNIRISSDEEPKYFGFWVYFKEKEEQFVIRKRIGFLSFECSKFNPSDEETGVIYEKMLDNSFKLFSNDNIFVSLFYNAYEWRGLSPIKSFFYGTTKFYKFLAKYKFYKDRYSQRKFKKALSHFKDRFMLLEALISFHEEQKNSFEVILDDQIDMILLASRLTNSESMSAYFFTIDQIDSTLRSLESDDLISTNTNNSKVKLLPKAWSELSKYIVEERRHIDRQKSLKWQIILTLFLVLASLLTAFLTFIRPDVQSAFESFVSKFF
jgi:hypothetical protein